MPPNSAASAVKNLNYCLLVSISLLTGGCITMNTIDSARGAPRDDGQGGTKLIDQPHPGYYWMLPLTVTGDIATAPFQGLFMLWAWATQWNG